MAALQAQTTQAAALAALLSTPSSKTAQAAAVVGRGIHPPVYAFSHDNNAEAARLGTTVPYASQVSFQVAYGTHVPEKFNSRAWAFDQDGHTFYVLSLGVTGTYVYDKTTGQWSQWSTSGYDIWNAELGTMWKGLIVAADIQNPSIFEVDPSLSLDEGFRPIERIVSGYVTRRGRGSNTIDSVSISASVGSVQLANYLDTATLSFRFSKDDGDTWTTYGPFTLSATDKRQELAFRSLGLLRYPGRLFEIIDEGGPVRIDGANIYYDGEDNG